jgi:hypothetical protein
MPNHAGRQTLEYMTDFPPRKLLENKLHEAVRRAREGLRVNESSDENQ